MRILALLSLLFTFQSLYASTKLNNEFQFEIENDSIMQTDMYYSSGVRLMYKRTIAQGSDSRFRLRLGYIQEMYTPEDLESEDAVVGDHPYAGLQYGLLGLSYSSKTLYFRSDLWRGVQGSRSRAGDIQKFIHKVTSSDAVNGWGNQTGEQSFWNGDFMILKRFTGAIFEFSPWIKVKTGDLRNEVEPGVKLGMRPGIMGLFSNISVVYVNYNAILQGPKDVQSIYVISDDNMNDKYYKADGGISFNFKTYRVALKSTWTGPQFKRAKSHAYTTLSLSCYW